MMRFAVIPALLVAAPVAAHHGWSSYDEGKPITATGTFAKVSWANPHGSAVMIRDKQSWTIVLAPVQRMEARGLSEAMIAPGKPVSVVGYARRDGTREMRIERITAGGKTVELR